MNKESTNIDYIIDACLAGKQSGYKELFGTFYSFGKLICARHCSNKEDAEEILNDVFIKIFKNLERFDRNKPFKGWFRTITVNTCIDFYRGKNLLQFESVEANDQLKLETENILDKFGHEEVLGMVQALPITFRTVFLLFVVEGYSHKEIAEKLQINEITSRTSLNKARAILQKKVLESEILNN